jgi:hypothetical protein
VIIFLAWVFVAIYSIANIVLILVALRWSWGLSPPDPEIANRLRRIEHDKAIVRAGSGGSRLIYRAAIRDHT